MNRRNLLIGIGTAAVGTGGVLGSGALTQVDATRSVTIGVNDDSSALLGLSPTGDVPEVSTDSTGEIQFQLPINLNDKAVTTFGEITGSTGSKTVNTAAFNIENGDAGTESGSPNLIIDATVNGGTGTDILNILTVDGSGNEVDLTVNDTTIELGTEDSPRGVVIEVNTDDSNDYGSGGSSVDVNISDITFTATTP